MSYPSYSYNCSDQKYLKNNFTFTSLKTLTLLDKPSRREVPLLVDYIGFEIDNVFVYGYGLDDQEYKRNEQSVKVKGE